MNATKKPEWDPIPEDLDVKTAIKLVRAALRKRSGKDWSVTARRYWVSMVISSPPARRERDAEGLVWCNVSDVDARELERLLDMPEGSLDKTNGYRVCEGKASYTVAVYMARGLEPPRALCKKASWDSQCTANAQNYCS